MIEDHCLYDTYVEIPALVKSLRILPLMSIGPGFHSRYLSLLSYWVIFGSVMYTTAIAELRGYYFWWRTYCNRFFHILLIKKRMINSQNDPVKQGTVQWLCHWITSCYSLQIKNSSLSWPEIWGLSYSGAVSEKIRLLHCWTFLWHSIRAFSALALV